jgi:hypothetical protein
MGSKVIIEATTSSASGKYSNTPLTPGERLFNKQQMQPFYVPTSEYDSAELAYDSYDGEMSTPKKEIKKKEKIARKISKYIKDHPTLSDDDGNILDGPLNVKEGWIEVTDDLIVEDLAVWFGTKKKPKGSSQPKGPWVNICKKVDGKHPPCGRPEASDKSYPKCRAAGVAGKMTDAQKRAACQQKRKAEKSHNKSGTGNSPKMTHYELKKKTNEEIVLDIIKKTIKEQLQLRDPRLDPHSETQFIFQCLKEGGREKTIPFVLWVQSHKKKVMTTLGIDEKTLKLLTKAAIGIMGRESTFGNSNRYAIKSLIDTVLGVGSSYGPAQMKTPTWDALNVAKKFGFSESDIRNFVGAGIGALTFLADSYKKAISNGYSTNSPSSNIKTGTGNGALDISIGSYNFGSIHITRYCKLPNDKTAHVCNSNEKQIQNYLPNYTTDKWYSGKISTHGYVSEVANHMKSVSCVDNL